MWQRRGLGWKLSVGVFQVNWLLKIRAAKLGFVYFSLGIRIMGQSTEEKCWNETRIWKEIISQRASKTEWDKREVII